MNKFDRLSCRYVAETLAATALFVAASFVAHRYLEDKSGLTINLLISFLATVPMLLVLWALVRYFRNVDERERYIMAIAGAITLLVGVFVALFLAKLDTLLSVDLNLYAAFLLVLWSFTTVVVRWKS
jgi:glucan phosphoethanolaminetransferase (alkaline phosphatase superfamily)